MKNTKTSVITFALFLNLYIALTFFWNLSAEFYQALGTEKVLESMAPFLASLLIVVRHAQVIEITFNISKQNGYSLGILGLTLPVISTLLQQDITIELTGGLLAALLVFELLLLKPGKHVVFFCGKAGLGVAWLAIYLAQRKGVQVFQTVSEAGQLAALYLMFSAVLFAEILHTCKSMPTTFRDRYDLYMLAYFSVAGVLFNYCSEHLANNRLRSYMVNQFDSSDAILFLFWIIVLVRIVQSLHLAALDYQDTQLKGLDLFILSIFYIFITAYRVLDRDNVHLYILLLTLSAIACAYFAYMRFVRIHKEIAINLRYDKRIQSVNTIAFGVVAVANSIMLFRGYSWALFLVQIVMLVFNIFHSHRLTMWVKFDLLQRNGDDGMVLLPVECKEALKVAAIINRNFGYIYDYCLGAPGSKRKSLRFIHLLLSSSSAFGWFGMSHFYRVYDNQKRVPVGLVCLKANPNFSVVYTCVSALAFVVKCLAVMGIRSGLASLSSFLRHRRYLGKLDLSEEGALEVTYLVIDKGMRRLGYGRKLMMALLNANIKNRELYPHKQLNLNRLCLLVREANSIAMAAMQSYGFQLEREIRDAEFDGITGKGGALVMQRSMAGGGKPS
jgi:ribosomal protein S18 acetylase RimI-like enzyme